MPRRSVRHIPAAAAAILALTAPAAAVSVADVPSPRPNGRVVDGTGTLAPSMIRDLNRLGERVREETGAELAVVVVRSVDGADPHAFAVRLFNRWGIGDARRRDGVLVFVALEDRAAEIVLGDGVADSARRRASDQIMAEIMVPRFRRGQPARAVSEGAQACARRILGLGVAAGATGARSAEPGSRPPMLEAPEGAAPVRSGRSRRHPRGRRSAAWPPGAPPFSAVSPF